MTTQYLREREWLSISEAARHMGCARRTIYNWMESGKLDIRRTVAGSVRIWEPSLWKRPESEPAAQAPEVAYEQG